ncbi:PREDICTED: uncharacterized protein LOC109345725 [Lupinus angustifolius]|nr:PREDICTED: uncharacterized protein LOC109345725 [Lupinus angustifolius]
MEEELRSKIETTVLEIVKQSNMEDTTEFTIRVAASHRLGIDLSLPERKQLVRTVIESYLVSVAEGMKNNTVVPESNEIKENSIVVQDSSEMVELKMKKIKKEEEKLERIVCQLSNRRNVSVGNFKGSTLVSIREFYCRDGKQLPGPKGISLSTEQWSAFKKSVPAIEEAIAKMERKMGKMQSTQCRNDLHGKQNGDVLNSAVDVAPLELVPIEVIRFDGKNYQFWAEQMELLLKQLKIEYVLTEPCPSSTLAENSSAEAKAAEKRRVNDDLLCQRNILNHLSDPLFNQYANRRMSAKELWEELKQVYMFEKFGTKRSLVKTYIEFQIVEEKAITEQIQELNCIADSLGAAEMSIDENFHVSVIISKLPLSWKNFCIKLMREEHLPFWKLMERVRIEEESRNGVKRSGDPSNRTGFHRANKFEPRRTENKQPPGKYLNKSEANNAKSIACDICGKKGHLSRNCWGRK